MGNPYVVGEAMRQSLGEGGEVVFDPPYVDEDELGIMDPPPTRIMPEDLGIVDGISPDYADK